MSLCVKIPQVHEEISRKLFIKIDWILDIYFIHKKKLCEMGWCVRYVLDRRSINLKKDDQLIRKTEIVEFYWYNLSPNRNPLNTSFTPFALCDCMVCSFFKSLWSLDFLKNKVMENVKIIFRLFLHCWSKVAQWGNLTNLDVEIITSYIFGGLKIEWVDKQNGDLEKLKYLTSALNYLPEKINPNFYINNQDAYLDELNDYYTRSKFNDSMIQWFICFWLYFFLEDIKNWKWVITNCFWLLKEMNI